MDKQEAEKQKIDAVIERARSEALEFAKGKTVAELTESLVDLYFHLYAEREQSRVATRISECTAAILDGAYKQMRDAGIEPDKSIALQQKRLLDAEVAEHTALMMKLQERAEESAAAKAKAEVIKTRNAPLNAGRKAGTRANKDKADALKANITGVVRKLFERPQDPIDKHGTLVTSLTNPQLARVVRGLVSASVAGAYEDSTFIKIVNTEAAAQRRLQKERLKEARPDLC